MEQPAGKIRPELLFHHRIGSAADEYLSAFGFAGHGVSLQGNIYAEQYFGHGELSVRVGDVDRSSSDCPDHLLYHRGIGFDQQTTTSTQKGCAV